MRHHSRLQTRQPSGFRRTQYGAVFAALLGLLVTGLTVGLTAPARAAYGANSPVAIGVDSAGTSYVGLASGSTLMRIDASGVVLAPIPLNHAGPPTGVSVAPDDSLWVSYGDRVSRLGADGSVLADFAVGATCAADPAHNGGLVVTGDAVFVASLCSDTVAKYSRSGSLQATVSLPGRPRGLAWGSAQNGQPAKLYVAVPSTGRVLTFDAAAFADGAAPIDSLALGDVTGFAGAVPSGVAVDKWGQLLVLDRALHAVYFFDTNNTQSGHYGFYRTLGHPTSPSSQLGSLDSAEALAMHAQDGSALAGNLFLADTANNRVQRWGSDGYTHWATPTGGGGGTPSAPLNTALPAVTGTAAVGQTLTCTDGSWSGAPTSFAYAWNINGSYVGGADSKTWQVPGNADGQQVTCAVQATNAAGSGGWATSAPISIATSASAPVNTSAPTITGTAAPGNTLTCQSGGWTGNPSYAFAWLRSGTVVGSGATYAVQAADVGQTLTCQVTATNGVGSTNATSAPVTPTNPNPTQCNGPRGISIAGGAEYTTTPGVSLRIRPPAGATTVTIANDGGFDGATTQALNGQCTYSWTLNASSTQRATKAVYVRFDSTGGQTWSDDIVLDGTAPVLKSARLVKRGHAPGATVLRTQARDKVSGVAKIVVAKKKSGASRTLTYKKHLAIKKLRSVRFVRVIDRAGNVSRWVRVKR